MCLTDWGHIIHYQPNPAIASIAQDLFLELTPAYFTTDEAQSGLDQYKEFVDRIVPMYATEMRTFNSKTQRLDELYDTILGKLGFKCESSKLVI